MAQLSYQNGLIFTQAHKLVYGHVYAILAPYGLNTSLWSLLCAVLVSPDGIRLSRVARIMNVKPPLVTILTNRLVQRGLVTRIPHLTDGRVKLLMATNKGRKLGSVIDSELEEEINTLLHGLSSQETKSFQKALEIIIHNASPA